MNVNINLDDRIFNFFESLFGIKNVNGGADFHLAPNNENNPIDIAVRFDNFLFIIEYKGAKEPIYVNIKSWVQSLKLKIKKAYEGLNENSLSKGCNHIITILITENILLSEQDKIVLKNEKEFYHFEYKSLNYFYDLYKKIGHYAKYHFLADLKLYADKDRKQEKGIRVTAIKQKLNKYVTYLFLAKPKDLLMYSYVARRRSSKKNYYQRNLDENRIKKMKNFILNKGVFPGNLVLSVNRRASLNFYPHNGETKTHQGQLQIGGCYDACWVVDGQHRLYAFAKLTEEEIKTAPMIPCLAFENLDLASEMRFFLEINREQKGIHKDLIWDLEGITNKNSPKGIISNTVRALSNTPLFHEKISIPIQANKKPSITMISICDGIAKSGITKQTIKTTKTDKGTNNPIYNENSQKLVENTTNAINNYFCSLKESFGQETEYMDFILSKSAISIILNLLGPILIHLNDTSNNIKSYIKYTNLIANFFRINYPLNKEEKIKIETSSNASRLKITKKIGSYIQDNLDPNFWSLLERESYATNIEQLEKSFQEIIDRKISMHLQKEVLNRYNNLILPFSKQEKIIAVYWKDKFKDVFMIKNGFKDLKEVLVAFIYFNLIKFTHSNIEKKLTTDDVAHFELYEKKMKLVSKMFNESLLSLNK